MEANEVRLEALDLNQQGALLLKNGNLDQAKAKFDRAVELDPMVMESYKNYGDLCMEMQKYAEAKSYYKKAMLIEKRGELYFLYGNACFMNDNPHEGLENYNLAISNGFDNEDMLFFMGMAYEHLNDDEMALRYIQKACIKNSSRADFNVKKISVLVRLGMMDRAEEETDKLLLEAPELYDGYHIKIQLLINKGNLEEAVKFAKDASDRFPEDADLKYDYIKSVTLSGQLDDALRMIQNAKQMKYYEISKRNFIMLEAQIYAEKGDIDRAIEGCMECKKLEQEDLFDSEARFMLVNLYLANKQYDKAYEESSQIVDKEMEDMYYYAGLYYKGFCMKQTGKIQEAAELFKEAAQIYRMVTLENPGAIDIYLYRAMTMKELKQYDEALNLLEMVTDIAGERAEIHTLRAEIYNVQGKTVIANEELDQAFTLKPELRQSYSKVGE